MPSSVGRSGAITHESASLVNNMSHRSDVRPHKAGRVSSGRRGPGDRPGHLRPAGALPAPEALHTAPFAPTLADCARARRQASSCCSTRPFRRPRWPTRSRARCRSCRTRRRRSSAGSGTRSTGACGRRPGARRGRRPPCARRRDDLRRAGGRAGQARGGPAAGRRPRRRRAARAPRAAHRDARADADRARAQPPAAAQRPRRARQDRRAPARRGADGRRRRRRPRRAARPAARHRRARLRPRAARGVRAAATGSGSPTRAGRCKTTPSRRSAGTSAASRRSCASSSIPPTAPTPPRSHPAPPARDRSTPTCPGRSPTPTREFLHDLRVAVRRTRALQRELRGVFAPEPLRAFRDGFKELQRITGPTRDLDVQLLEFDELAAGAARGGRRRRRAAAAAARGPPRRRAPRDGPRAALGAHAHDARQLARLRRRCSSTRRRTTAPTRRAPIAEVAGERIAKVYRQMVKMGSAIDDGSPAEALHELRKKGKELRYLLEFFSSLYPARGRQADGATLKGLQDVLGPLPGSRGPGRAAALARRRGRGARRRRRRADGDGRARRSASATSRPARARSSPRASRGSPPSRSASSSTQTFG